MNYIFDIWLIRIYISKNVLFELFISNRFEITLKVCFKKQKQNISSLNVQLIFIYLNPFLNSKSISTNLINLISSNLI